MKKSNRRVTVLALGGVFVLLTASPAFAGGRGDNFNHPIPIQAVVGPKGIPYTDTHHTNNNATTQTNEPTPSCQSSFSRTFWYVFSPPITEFYFANTIGSNFDTVLALYTYDGSTFTPLACDDDSGAGHGGANGTSWMQTPTLTVGTLYYFQVASYAAHSGYLVFNLND